MKVAQILLEMKIYNSMILKKDQKYIMAGSVISQLQKIYPGGVIERDNFAEIYNKLNIENVKNGDGILVFRSGGIGDVMFTIPLLRFLKKAFPLSKISAGTVPLYLDVLKNNPFVDEIVPMPFTLDKMKESKYHLMFEGLIEDERSDSKKLNAVDLFLKEANVDYRKISFKDKNPTLFITEEEIKIREKIYKKLGIEKGGGKYIGIQMESSSPIRNFPFNKFVFIIKELIFNRGYSVIIFGGKRQIESAEYLLRMMEQTPLLISTCGKFSLRESIIIASGMDLIIAPDSSFIHIAGGLNIPVIGLYGCFPSMLRMRYYNKAIGIDADVPCSPSFIHGHFPCYKGDPSPCFSVISINNVMDAIDHIFELKKIESEYPRYNEFEKGEIVYSPFLFEKFIPQN